VHLYEASAKMGQNTDAYPDTRRAGKVGRDLYAVLDQVVALLYRRGRVTYNALKLQFALDDTHLGVLKEELLYAYPQVADDQGRGLIWTSDASLLASPGVIHSAVLRFAVCAACWRHSVVTRSL
jgi:hypothetical protein